MNKKILSFLLCFLIIFSNSPLFSLNNYQNQAQLEIFKQKQNVDYPLIFIHGIGRGVESWALSAKELTNSNYYEMEYIKSNKIYHNYFGQEPEQWVWSVSYYTNNYLEELLSGNLTLYAHRLQKMIQMIQEITGSEKVILIAHSMGGLVARKYMTLEQANWDAVHKILTLGTPHQGVITAIDIVGQLEDLKTGSLFLQELEQNWAKKSNKSKYNKWGVIGAIDPNRLLDFKNGALTTDSGGPGYVMIYSAIPYGEWQEAIAENINKIALNTPNFAFRLAVKADHLELLYHAGTFAGIEWALTDFN